MKNKPNQNRSLPNNPDELVKAFGRNNLRRIEKDRKSKASKSNPK